MNICINIGIKNMANIITRENKSINNVFHNPSQSFQIGDRLKNTICKIVSAIINFFRYIFYDFWKSFKTQKPIYDIAYLKLTGKKWDESNKMNPKLVTDEQYFIHDFFYEISFSNLTTIRFMLNCLEDDFSDNMYPIINAALHLAQNLKNPSQEVIKLLKEKMNEIPQDKRRIDYFSNILRYEK